MTDNQIALKRDVADLLQSKKVQDQVALAVPGFLTTERLLRICVTTCNRNTDLLKCTPESLLGAVMTAAQMGIEPDGRHGHLIPRWNSKANCYEATFQADYKGLVRLIRLNDKVVDVYAELVHEHDFIKVTKGLHRDLVHEVDIKADRGELIGVYAVIQYENEHASFEYMCRAEVENVRARSDSWKAHKAKGYGTPWVTDEGEMWKKTALKRISKLADLSGDTSERLAADPDRLELLQNQPATAAPIKQATLLAAQEKTAGLRALPDPADSSTATGDEAEQGSEPSEQARQEPPKPAAKAPATKPKAEKPKADKPAQEAPTGPAAAVATNLDRDGYTVAELIQVMIKNEFNDPKCPNLDPATTQLADLSDEILTMVATETNWPMILGELEAVRSEGGAQ